MPWKLIAFIVAVALVLAFVGFNLENSADVSLVFVTFRAVPVYVTMLTAFLLGLAVSIPFSFRSRRKQLPAARTPAPTGEPVGRGTAKVGKRGRPARDGAGDAGAEKPEAR